MTRISVKKVLIVSRVSLFPTEHGGAKNIQSVLKSLRKNDVECRVLVKLHPQSISKQRFFGQHLDDLKNYQFDSFDNDQLCWSINGVSYVGVHGDSKELAKRAECEIENFRPDAFFLCDDGFDDARNLFDIGAKSGRLVFLAQTIHCLPFGPYSMAPSKEVAESIKQASQIIAPSRFVAEYIKTYLGGNPGVYYPPVFGSPPFPKLSNFQNPFITFINPCPWKGSSIFLRLARVRKDLEFAVVPTWGATDPLMQEIKALSNVTVLKETPEIDQIFKQTRILLAPSLCQEAFGLVSPEALLRGVPVVASAIGGLPESTLGVAHTIPVNPLSFDRLPKMDGHPQLGWAEPENSIEPWSHAIDEILKNEASYDHLSQKGKEAAEAFVQNLNQQSILSLLS